MATARIAYTGGGDKRFFGYISPPPNLQHGIFDMIHAAVAQKLARHPIIGKFFVGGVRRQANALPGGSLATEMDRLIRVNFVEGFMGLRPNSLAATRASQVLSRMSAALNSAEPESNPYVAALLEHGEEVGDLQGMFATPDSRIYASLQPLILKRSPTSSKMEAGDMILALIAGLNPNTNEPWSRTRGKPLFWHIGNKFREAPRGAGSLRNRVLSFAVRTGQRFMLDLARSDAREVSMDGMRTPRVDVSEEGYDLNSVIPAEVPEFDFQSVMENPEVQKALEDGVLARIQARAANPHGLSDADRRKSIETAIWNVIKNDPEDVLIGVDDSLTFSVKQNELARRVESLTGYPVNPMIVGRIFRDTVGDDLKRVLSSPKLRGILNRISDVARTYLSDRRRKMASRVVQRYLSR